MSNEVVSVVDHELDSFENMIDENNHIRHEHGHDPQVTQFVIDRCKELTITVEHLKKAYKAAKYRRKWTDDEMSLEDYSVIYVPLNKGLEKQPRTAEQKLRSAWHVGNCNRRNKGLDALTFADYCALRKEREAVKAAKAASKPVKVKKTVNKTTKPTTYNEKEWQYAYRRHVVYYEKLGQSPLTFNEFVSKRSGYRYTQAAAAVVSPQPEVVTSNDYDELVASNLRTYVRKKDELSSKDAKVVYTPMQEEAYAVKDGIPPEFFAKWEAFLLMQSPDTAGSVRQLINYAKLGASVATSVDPEMRPAFAASLARLAHIMG